MPTDRMLTKREISTYAETLLAAAKAEDVVFKVYDQLDQAAAIIRGNIELREVLGDVAIERAKRVEIVQEVFKGFNPALVAFLGVVVDRDDIALLPRIVEEYSRNAEEDAAVVVVDVATAVELDDALRATIKKKLAADLGRDIILREKVDPSLIGGIVMSTHGKRIDASIVSQLENARIVLSTVPSGGER